MKKSGRRRWNVGGTMDSTDDLLDDLDFSVNYSKKPSPIKAPLAKRRDSFLDDEDFFGSVCYHENLIWMHEKFF